VQQGLEGLVRNRLFRASVASNPFQKVRHQRRQIFPPLVAHFWNGLDATLARKDDFGRVPSRPLLHYDWPGNVRELDKFAGTRLVLSAPPARFKFRDLPNPEFTAHHRFDGGPASQGNGIVPMANWKNRPYLNALTQVNGDKIWRRGCWALEKPRWLPEVERVQFQN